MKGLILIMIVHVLLSSRVDTLVVSKLHINSFINYYQEEIMKHNVEKIKELFSKQDLFKYCDRLRQAIIYDAVNTSEEFFQEPSEVVHVFSKGTLELEKDNAQMQLFNFRLGNSKETRAFYGFICVNFEENMSWIVSPTFLPDSAFLFEFELNFRHLSQRELQRVKEVVARSVAFVDEEAIRVLQNTSDIVLKYSEKPDERDPLCDLNQVLQYRLCSLALNSFEAADPRENGLEANDRPINSRNYTVQEYRQYFDLNNAEDRCSLVKLMHKGDSNITSTSRKLLICPVNKTKYNTRPMIYIGLDPFNSTNIFCTIDVWDFLARIENPKYWIVQIPLLSYLDLHENIHNEDNNY